METTVTRQQALALLRKYNREPFHLQHALTVEGVMHWYARQLGFGMEEDFGGWLGCCTMSILKHTRRSTVKGAGAFGGDPCGGYAHSRRVQPWLWSGVRCGARA